MLSTVQLLEQLTLQHRMNVAVSPNWINANYPWTRAIMVEGVEALEHIGWKWWKKSPPPNMSQFHLELVDIWHFALSLNLVHAGGDPHEAAANLRTAARYPQHLMDVQGRELDIRHLDLHGLLHLLIGAAAFGEFHQTSFSLLLEKSDMTWNDLHKAYMAKNVLNLFRQAHGYQDGTYIKTWHGREDNEVLTELMNGGDLSADELMQRLDTAYAAVAAAPFCLEPST